MTQRVGSMTAWLRHPRPAQLHELQVLDPAAEDPAPFSLSALDELVALRASGRRRAGPTVKRDVIAHSLFLGGSDDDGVP